MGRPLSQCRTARIPLASGAVGATLTFPSWTIPPPPRLVTIPPTAVGMEGHRPPAHQSLHPRRATATSSKPPLRGTGLHTATRGPPGLRRFLERPPPSPPPPPEVGMRRGETVTTRREGRKRRGQGRALLGKSPRVLPSTMADNQRCGEPTNRTRGDSRAGGRVSLYREAAPGGEHGGTL